jgi:hypothetical protein
MRMGLINGDQQGFLREALNYATDFGGLSNMATPYRLAAWIRAAYPIQTRNKQGSLTRPAREA